MRKFYLFNIYILLLFIPLISYSQSWNKVNSIPVPYNSNYWLDVFFLPANPDYGWICGYRGQVIRTTDRGKTWAGSVVQFADHLESVHFTSTSVGYTSGEQGIFKSNNGGASWRDITPPNALTLWGCYFVDDDYGVALGEGCNSGQKFWLTTDGGNNWLLYQDSVPQSGLTDAIIYSRNGLGYAASSGKIWRTLDGGYTWQVFSTSGPNYWQEEITNIGASFLVPMAGNSCGGMGNNGAMHFSTDNGATWNSYTTGVPMFGTFLINQNTGWACGFNRAVYYTTNGGQTWVIRNCGIDNGNLDDIWFITPNEGWVVGEGVYYLGPDRQDVTKLNMVYGDVCIPDSKLDTFWIKNHSFNNVVMVNTNLYGVNFEDFSVVYPPGGFPVLACDSQMVIVRFNPQLAGNKSAKLGVNVLGGASFTLDLLGSAKKMTSVPEDSLLEINPAFCGMNTVDSLKWTANSPDNSIISIQKIDGSYEIVSESLLPINVYSNGVYTYFSTSPSDTGWFESRFRVRLLPCSVDTIITIRAYGVSPIITADDRINFNLNCKLSEFDTIPVYNTGNSELVISDYNFNKSNTAFSYEGWTSGRTLPITINPFESDSLIIRFLPPISGAHSAVLTLTNNDSTSIRGRKNPFYISFSGIVTSTDVIPKDSVYYLNDICLGDSVVLSIPMKNKGDLTAILQNPTYDNSIIKVSVDGKSFPFQLKTNDSVTCQIVFKPNSIKQYIDTIYISSLPCNELTRIVIIVNCVDSYITVEPDSITGTIQTGMPLRKTATVHAFGNIPMSISDVRLNPPSSDWALNISPSLPYNINAGDSVEFTIDFTSSKDTVLKNTLLFSLDSYCPIETSIPVNLLSHSVWLRTSADSVGFGYRKCLADILYDTLTITNEGAIADTLTMLEIQPSGQIFSILNPPSLPHIIPSGASENYIISFDASVEGIFSGTLVINSKNLRGLSINLPVSGEFRTVNTTPDEINIDFSNVEPCQDTIVKTFYIKNTGTLTDSLTISRTTNQKGFEIVPQNNIVIDSGDSVSVIILLIPSEFKNAGAFNEQYILSSIVCPNIHKVDAAVNIIRPRLTIEPKSIDFGSVWIDDSLMKYIDIKNESNYIKRINSLSITPVSSQFRFEAQFPVDLVPNRSVRVPVTFTSKIEGTEQRQLEIVEESICVDTSYVELTADVPPEIYNTTVKIGNYRGTPGDTITVEAELIGNIPRVKPDRLDFALSFDKRLFFPLKVSTKFRNSRQLINFSYYPDTLYISIDKQFAEILFQEEGNIIFIDGMILKSIPDSTGLFITEFKLITNKKVNISRIDGSLKAENICLATGGFLIKLVNTLNTSLDNPIINSDQLIIEILYPDEQNVTNEIWDIMGNLRNKDIIHIKKNTESYSLNINNLESGVYFLTIKSDKYYSGRYRFMIIR